MTLSRRDLLKRIGAIGSGAAALALVGCGEDASTPQPQPVQANPEAESEARPQPVEQPVEQTEQPEPQQTAEPVSPPEQQEPRQPGEEQAAAADRSQVGVVQQEQPSVQARQVQQAEQVQQPEPPAERRLLVPDVAGGDYELQDPAFDPVAGARVDFGEIDGAGYRVELPEEWSGELVLWAHGFRGLNDEGTGFSRRLTFDEIPARDVIIGQGCGWATSTYRVNGYVPGVGVDDLLRVKDRVAEIARPPRRTYIAGGSMGGATAQLMAQEFPEEVAAALAFCPAMGNVWVVDYMVAWHALAHWLIGDVPQQLDVAGMLEWASALGTSDDGGLRLTALGEQFAALIADFTGGERWGFEDGLRQQWNIAFSLGVTLWPNVIDGGAFAPGEVISVSDDLPPADTSAYVYSADASAGIDLQRLNEEVIRFASEPVRRHDPGVGVPSGELRVPLLAMKTTGDLFTPIHLDRDYQRLVQESGWERNLVMQAVRRAGHCTFSEREALSAFTAMIGWLSFGFAPGGDDLQGDLSEVGIRFTDPFDEDDPLRPPT
ncbi:MAG: alpha/beta hydrolase [Chloroflexi bacterium]|nr:alpha/beta hydrolase [Chloroflexota bacterium]